MDRSRDFNLDFSTKLVEFLSVIRIETIPLLHVPQIRGAESLGFRKRSLKIQADLLNNAGDSFLFGSIH